MSIIEQKEFKLKNGKPAIIRSAMVKDAPQIVKLLKVIVKEGPYTLMEPDEFSYTIRSESKKIKRYNKAPGKVYIVAEIKKEVVGFIAFVNWDTRRTEHTGLMSMFIKRKYRNKGAGKALGNELLNWGKTNPVNKKISLYVFSTNKNAIALYKKLGFRVEGRFKNDMIINGKYVHSIAMYKFTSKITKLL
jgi:RimJ/RimL family protein N-acetyltransferase